jgi:putative ABC transport system permease protein
VDFTPYLTVPVRFASGFLKPLSEAAVDRPLPLDVTLAGTWFSHHLELPTGEALDTGMRNMKSWWDVTGEWPAGDDEDAAMAGSLVAAREGIAIGDTIVLSAANGETKTFTVKGVFNAGGAEDERIYVPLAAAQSMARREGQVSSVEVSALTTPDNELSRRAGQDPGSLSIAEWETWYCTAYVSAICYQIDEVVSGAVSKPIRQVAESEGAILGKTQLLMLLITILSLAGSALGISNLVTASVMERAPEIGLLKAVGAGGAAISALVLTEILITGAAGGAAGYFAGLGFAQLIGHTVFGSSIAIQPTVIPLAAALVLLVTLAGSLPSIRFLLSLRPAEVLHGR